MLNKKLSLILAIFLFSLSGITYGGYKITFNNYTNYYIWIDPDTPRSLALRPRNPELSTEWATPPTTIILKVSTTNNINEAERYVLSTGLTLSKNRPQPKPPIRLPNSKVEVSTTVNTVFQSSPEQNYTYNTLINFMTPYAP